MVDTESLRVIMKIRNSKGACTYRVFQWPSMLGGSPHTAYSGVNWVDFGLMGRTLAIIILVDQPECNRNNWEVSIIHARDSSGESAPTPPINYFLAYELQAEAWKYREHTEYRYKIGAAVSDVIRAVKSNDGEDDDHEIEVADANEAKDPTP